MDTFQNFFGGGGNLAEIEFDWVCDNCNKKLDFNLIVEDKFDVSWLANCCGIEYTIDPYVAAYNKRKLN